MADVVVRQIAFYWRNKKAAETNSVEVEFNNGREKLIGQEGILAYSKGIATMKVTIAEVVPVTGSTTTNDIEKILDQEDIDVSFILGGKFYKQKMAVMTASYKSDTEKGVTTGNIVLEGAKPKVSG
jgi:hypothetical protein